MMLKRSVKHPNKTVEKETAPCMRVIRVWGAVFL